MADVISCGESRNAGEKRLVEQLRKLPDDYCILANYKIEGRGNPLDVDVLLLAPHAIYVIEDKNWSGEISGDQTGWYQNGKERGNVMDTVAHKAVVLKSALREYYSGFDQVAVQSCVSLSAEETPNIERLDIARKDYVLRVDQIAGFVQDPKKLESPRNTILPGRYQAMLRRALVKGLKFPREINGPSGPYKVERVAYTHNRYTPYLARRGEGTLILKCYDLPKDQPTNELEQFVQAHRRVIERYQDVLDRLQEEPRDDSARYIEIGEASFIDKEKGLYVVQTRWQSGGWELLSQKRGRLDLNTKLEIASRLCRGLEYAHAHGIVHRNLSLDSVLVTDSGEARIIDWDFAIFWDEQERRQVHGTTYYFKDSPAETRADLRKYERFQAPELLKEKASQDIVNQAAVNNVAYELACPETDLYSLGVVLYEFFADRDFTAERETAKAALLSQRLIEESADHILALCGEKQNRKRELLSKLAALFEEQAGQKCLPRMSPKYTWTLDRQQFTNARERHETRMSVSYCMEQIQPEKRSVIVKFLKTESQREANAEQEDIQALLRKIDPRYVPAWIRGGSIFVTEEGKFAWNADSHTKLRYYQIFEYIEGTRLDDAIVKRQCSEPEIALRLGLQMLRAVEAVHEAGWVHYDIKPDNFILLHNWRELLDDPAQPQAVKLIDFGSAHRIGQEALRKSLSPGFKSPRAYEVKTEEKYQFDLNSTALVITAMLCGLNPAPSYGPNLDMDLLKQAAGERVSTLLENMTLPSHLEWKYKTVSPFILELEKALQRRPDLAVEDAVAPVEMEQEIQRGYETIRKNLAKLYDEVMGPIQTRVDHAGFGFVDPESREQNDKANNACAKARNQIEELTRLKHKAEYHAVNVGFDITQIEREWALVDLQRRLAWALNEKDAEELTQTIEDARQHVSEKGEQADNLVKKLYDQAIKRREELGKAELSVGTTGRKTGELENLSIQLSDLDTASIEYIREIQNTFKDIIKYTNTFEKLQIKYGKEEVHNTYQKLFSSQEQHDKIRTSVLNAIREFEVKARKQANPSPLTARRWFEAVDLLKGFLDETQDASKLKELAELRDQIEKNCAQWEQANGLLSRAEGLLKNPIQKMESYWQACHCVGDAFQAYSQHAGVHLLLNACVEKIVGETVTSMSDAQKTWTEDFPKSAAVLLPEDWQAGQLVNFDLPRWLEAARQQAERLVLAVRELETRLRGEFGEVLFQQEAGLIQPAIQRALDKSSEIEQWMGVQVNKRREIRSVIGRLQALVDETNIKQAQSEYDEFCVRHPDWTGDAELSAAREWIAGHLDIPELVRLARVSFAREEWGACIAYCLKVKNMAERVKLSAAVDEEYRSRYLDENSTDLPREGYTLFVPVLKQLAFVYQAGQNLETLWARQDYAAGKTWLEHVDTYGMGVSPLVETEKQRIAFEEKKAEYHRRKQYGDENFVLGTSISELAEKYGVEVEKQRQIPLITPGWIEKTRNLAVNLLEFDPEQRTLWVGKRKIWLVELSSAFLRQYTAWVGSLQSQQSASESDLELALSCLKTVRRLGRLLSLDSQQRRWVVLHYYEMCASQVGQDHKKVVGVWREAVFELCDDVVIQSCFKAAQWEYWVWLLESDLQQLAEGQDVSAHFRALMAQEEPYAEDLFAPVQCADGNKIPFQLDRFHKKIVELGQLHETMVKADAEVAKDISSLDIVIRDLKDASRELNQPVLSKKADTLGMKFVESKIREGDDYKKQGRRAAMARAYIQAFVLAPQIERCIALIKDKTNFPAIEDHWNVIKRNVDDLNIQEGLIQSQLKRANELALEIEGIEKIRTYASISKKEVDSVRKMLEQKTLALTFGLSLLDHFSPSSDTWRKAIQPDGNDNINRSAWQHLHTYSKRLERDFGPDHAQIMAINGYSDNKGNKVIYHPGDLDTFEINVRALYANRDNLSDLLSEPNSPSLDKLLEDCHRINNSAKKLWNWEPKYQEQWKNWEGKVDYPVYYPNEYAAYHKWTFRVLGQPQEYPYWQETERFKNWVNWLSEFIDEEASNYRFDEEKWTRFWESQPNVMALLRSDYESNLLFLGVFLMLSLKISELWRQEKESAQQTYDDYEALYRGLSNNNLTWLTREYMRVVYEHLQKEIANQQRVLEEPLYFTKQSQEDRRLIESLFRKSDNLSQEFQHKISQLEAVERNLMETFNSEFDHERITAVDASKIQQAVLRQLEIFTDTEMLSFEILEYAKKLSISFDPVEKCYNGEIQPQHVFYKYASELSAGKLP